MDEHKVKSREAKLAGREKFRANPVNGRALVTLLTERSAKVRREARENRHAKAAAL